mgnify:CR=1 FL=1
MKHLHLAGIIPVAGLKTDFGIDTPEILMPVDAAFTAIQKAVFECSIAGCQTIWIVANQDLSPMVRKRVGEWVLDPVYLNRRQYGESSEHQREIPIYYVPIHPKDVGRRDSYGWSILAGIYAAWRTANHISKWVVPEKYFISFPMSAYNIYDLRKHRRAISDPSNNFLMRHDGHTVMDNMPLCFTMFGADYIHCRRHVNKETTKEFYNTVEGEQYPSKRLPIEERWTAKNFDLSVVFNKLNIEDAYSYEPEWFFDLSTWEGYKSFLGSDKIIKKPPEFLTKPHTHVKIPYKA